MTYLLADVEKTSSAVVVVVRSPHALAKVQAVMEFLLETYVGQELGRDVGARRRLDTELGLGMAFVGHVKDARRDGLVGIKLVELDDKFTVGAPAALKHGSVLVALA